MKTQRLIGASLVATLASILSGCSTLYKLSEKGPVWCNEAYPAVAKRAKYAPSTRDLSYKGYPYVTAAALALQKDSEEDKDHWIDIPHSFRQIHSVHDRSSGFEAKIFEYTPPNPKKKNELIIAFTGSNEIWNDWIATNFLGSQTQYYQANDLVQKFAPKYKENGYRIIASGFSLGGALAIHATYKTKDLIDETWALNPSPITWIDGEEDARLHVLSTDKEILKNDRAQPDQPQHGRYTIRAPENQVGQDFYAIKSTSIFSHFRYVLFRDVLHTAAYVDEEISPIASGEPRNILRRTDFASCKSTKIS